MTPGKIDYSDIPELSDRQLSAMRRVGRPTVGDEPRKLIAIRLDAKVLGWLLKAAEKKRAALSIARQRDLGQRDEKGKLGLSDAGTNVKSKDLTLSPCLLLLSPISFVSAMAARSER